MPRGVSWVRGGNMFLRKFYNKTCLIKQSLHSPFYSSIQFKRETSDRKDNGNCFQRSSDGTQYLRSRNNTVLGSLAWNVAS